MEALEACFRNISWSQKHLSLKYIEMRNLNYYHNSWILLEIIRKDTQKKYLKRQKYLKISLGNIQKLFNPPRGVIKWLHDYALRRTLRNRFPWPVESMLTIHNTHTRCTKTLIRACLYSSTPYLFTFQSEFIGIATIVIIYSSKK